MTRFPWAAWAGIQLAARKWRGVSVRILLSAEQIQQRVRELGQEIGHAFNGRSVTIVGVLTGCLIFLADLVRQLDLPTRIAFLQASSYRGTATLPGELKIDPGLLPDVRGAHVLLVDDILDTGRTLKQVADHLQALGVQSLATVVLLRKKGRQQVAVDPTYCGFEIPDVFVVGYGLDFNGAYRHLPSIAVCDEVPN
jgi:hypoxanthine phosphoribosyltransferase